MIKVKGKNKNIETKLFLQNGDLFLGAAQILFQSPAFFDAAATLSHLGIELILKGCLIWSESRYPKIHDLLEIANRISFLELSNENSNLLKKIDTFYHFRYPLDKKDADNIDKVLSEINDTTHGIQNLAGEFCTDDLG